ncbi:hypothetical protein SAMN04488134_12010 [Amphibacillus marinus]|uniref:LXG domain of WXG superfamily protein n=1 Tax=Amphibacillus marinus TaxID=872970 RepID=A0A1H8TVF9_9BACI|nr:hypothetical protein SAMN04488134_12010 [Amphibacillus marinus]
MFADLSRNLNRNLKAFQTEVDTHQRTLVREYDLEDVSVEIKDEFKKIKSYHNMIQSSLRSVSDIANVRMPSLEEVTINKDQSIRHINQLKLDINGFDRRKQASKMDTVMRQLNNNLKKTKGITGIARLDFYNKLVKSGELDQLKVYNKESSLSKRHTSTVRALINMYKPFNPIVPFNVFTKEALNRFLIKMLSGGQVNGNEIEHLVDNGKKVLESTTLATVIHGIGQSGSFRTASKMLGANKDGGMLGAFSHVNSRTGSSSFRLTINREGLAALGVEADYRAISDFNYRLPKNGQNWSVANAIRAQQNQTILRPADQKSLFRTQFTSLGEKVIGRHPEMQFLGSGIKHVGTSTLKGASQGAIEGFTDFYTVFSKNQSKVAFTSKSIGNAGTLLSFYLNYEEARDDGLSLGKSIGRAGLDTTVDTVIAGAVQKGITAAATAMIPIPGVGTAVGVIVGIGAVWALNHDWGGNGKTAMDVVKGWFR